MRILCFLLLCASCFVLSGCVADRLAFWSDDSLGKNYVISGLEDDEDTRQVIRTVVDDRFSDGLAEDEPLEFREEFVRRDLEKVMRSKGYYNSTVDLEKGVDGKATYNVKPGPVTQIRSVSVTPAEYKDKLAELDLKAGDALDANKVLAAQKKLYTLLQKESCAFDLSVKHSVNLNTVSHKADVTFLIRQGKKASFGEVTLSGHQKTDDEYIKRFIGWKQGDCFRNDKIAAAREKLLSTGFFSQVDVILPDNAAKRSQIPVEIVFKERARRSIKAGISYYSDEGVSVILGWEHRNLFGGAEKLNADLKLSVLEQSLDFNFAKPYFYRDDQSLSLNAKISREDTDAYEQIGISTGFGVKRKFTKHLSGRAGADLELIRIDDETEEEEENFGLVSPNASVTYDNRDDTLDPHEGWLLTGLVKPSFDVLGESSPFVRLEGTAQTYYEIGQKSVVAGRVMLGSVAGTNTEDLPATERFYAGGGGSVRGFGHQEVGPVDEDDDPVGGRSVFEGSLELRHKFTDKFGGVAFADAGYVDDEVFPSFDNLSVGAGLGVRYYTDFGPLRFDVAVPVSGDENTSDNFQIYISIGQAF